MKTLVIAFIVGIGFFWLGTQAGQQAGYQQAITDLASRAQNVQGTPAPCKQWSTADRYGWQTCLNPR